MSKLKTHLVTAWRSICLAVATSFAVHAAWAAEPAPAVPKKGEPRRNQAQPPVQVPLRPIEPLLTRDELRNCMTLQARNRQQLQDARQAQASLTAERDELKQIGEVLQADLTTLDRTSEEAVAAYNGRVAERQRRVAELERAVGSFNQMADAHEQARTRYARECENRKFDDRDEKAILGGS